jgi:hypothetical protein
MVDSDLLSASSLLLAVVTVLLGLWYPEITKAIEIQVPPVRANAGPQLRTIRTALRWRALPLAIGFLALWLIFLPDSLSVLDNTLDVITNGEKRKVAEYSASAAAFVAVDFASLLLCILTSIQCISLAMKLR